MIDETSPLSTRDTTYSAENIAKVEEMFRNARIRGFMNRHQPQTRELTLDTREIDETSPLSTRETYYDADKLAKIREMFRNGERRAFMNRIRPQTRELTLDTRGIDETSPLSTRETYYDADKLAKIREMFRNGERRAFLNRFRPQTRELTFDNNGLDEIPLPPREPYDANDVLEAFRSARLRGLANLHHPQTRELTLDTREVFDDSD